MRRTLSRAKTAFVTDLEGSSHHWYKYTSFSRAFFRDDNGLLHLRDGYNFVHGGDTFDKAPGDLLLAAELVDLKRRYPHRVALLVGNRDVNKLRLASELLEFGDGKDPSAVPLPFHQTPESPTYAQFLSARNVAPSRLAYLAYILHHTMGASETLEFRRRYLARHRTDAGDATDADVLKSFEESIQPGGAVLAYIEHADIAAAMDGTVFVHGAINATNAGFIPEPLTERRRDDVPPGRRVETVEEWIDGLREYKRVAMEKHLACPYFTAPRVRGASALIAAAHTPATRNCMPIVSPFVRDKAVHYIDAAAVDFLNRSGYSAVCVGHQPIGDVPLTISQPGLTFVAADLSYCGGKSDEDNRGNAVADVIVDGETGRILMRGRRVDGSEYEFDIEMGGDQLVGRRASDGWWVRGSLPNGNILLHRTPDRFFTNEYSVVSPSSLTLETSFEAVSDVITPGFTQSQLRPLKVCVKK